MRMMRLAAWMCLVAATACATMHVESMADSTTDFTGYETFSWAEGDGRVTGDARLAGNDLLDRRIKEVLAEHLAARGFRQSESGTGDFEVGYVAALESKVDFETINDYWGYRRSAVFIQTTQAREYDQGTLVIDIIDGTTGELAWRGTAQAELHNRTSEARLGKLNDAVASILSEFPPHD